MLLDFDPAVTGIASQPFWLRWHDPVRSEDALAAWAGAVTPDLRLVAATRASVSWWVAQLPVPAGEGIAR
jgi:hypothetical protein